MAIGSTLRPELGRMDFSGIERGGRAAAEAIMRGSEQLGAGIRSAGASIGQAMEKTGEMKSNIKAAQSVMQGITGMEGIDPKAVERLNMMSEQLTNEEIPLSQRNAMASTLRGMGSTLFSAGVQKMMETPVGSPELESVQVGGFNVLRRKSDGKIFQTSTVKETPEISQSQVNLKVLEALGNLGKDPEDVTDADITRISGGNAILAGALREERSQALAREAKSAADTQTGKSPYQIAMDKAAGEALAQWVYEDRVKAVNNLSTLNTVVSDLQSGAIETRTVIDFLPNFLELPQYLRSIFRSEEATAYAQVYGLVSQTLTEALGPQFTQIEGERQVNASYNPRLSGEQNIQLLNRTRLLVQETIKAKDALAKYANETGSLRGYTRPMPITVLNNGLEELETLQSEMLGEDISRKPDYISTSSGGTYRVEEIGTGK